MGSSTELVAELIYASGPAYASRAAEILLNRHPEVGARFGPRARAAWKADLERRLAELAGALSVDEPGLFRAHAVWAARAFRARGVPLEDLRASFEAVRDALDEALPEASRGAIGPYFAAAEEALAGPVAETPGLNPQAPNDRVALEYVLALLEGDERRASGVVLGALDKGLPVREAYLGVVGPALREMGTMWHAGEISVAEEHFVTAASERLLTRLLDRAPAAEPEGLTVLAGAVAGNAHQLGVRMVADFFEMAGWRVIFLGANIPPEDVNAGVGAFEPDVVVLSAMLSAQLDAMRATIAHVRALEVSKPPKILVGGSAFQEAEGVWERLGADGYAASPAEAVEVGARLVGRAGA